jgi:hypothetical protein
MPNVMDWKGKGKSKADVLKAWRTAQCASSRFFFHKSPLIPAYPPFPEHLLLRDTLYLLQGIDGRYIRFAVRPPAEQNPYRTEQGKANDGTAFPLGVNGGQVEDQPTEGDIVGIEIVADEAKVGQVGCYPDYTADSKGGVHLAANSNPLGSDIGVGFAVSQSQGLCRIQTRWQQPGRNDRTGELVEYLS